MYYLPNLEEAVLQDIPAPASLPRRFEHTRALHRQGLCSMEYFVSSRRRQILLPETILPWDRHRLREAASIASRLSIHFGSSSRKSVEAKAFPYFQMEENFRNIRET